MGAQLRHFFNPPVRPDGRGGLLAPWQIFWVGLLLRLAFMTVAHTYRIKPLEDHFKFGFEAGRIARALVTGFGYADPFANAVLAHTGPTAWLPPAYPLLLAAVFRVFGVYTRLSAWVILALQCAMSGSTGMAVWELGVRFAGVRCGRWAGWLWTLYPATMQYAVGWVWEMTLTTWLFAWVVVLAARMRAQPARSGTLRWAGFGLLWGLIGLSNSTLLLFLPVCGLWVLWGSRGRSWPGAVLAGVVFFACLAPWTLRNERVFHTFVPLRGNFGAELYMGNGPGANGFLMEYDHPFQSASQLRLYGRLGEVRYVKMRGEAARQVIGRDPAHFLRDTLVRIDFFWAGVPHPGDTGAAVEYLRLLQFSFTSLCGLLGLALALRRRMPFAGLWGWAFLLLPLPYYAVTVHARFRHPLEPLICILAVFLFQSARRNQASEVAEVDQPRLPALTS